MEAIYFRDTRKMEEATFSYAGINRTGSEGIISAISGTPKVLLAQTYGDLME